MSNDPDSNDTPSNTRSRRPEQRRAEILAAATRAFAKNGYHRTTTRDIADEAGISEGTIYNYFNSKDDLLFGIVQHLKEAINLDLALQQARGDDPHLAIEALFERRQQLLMENIDSFKTILGEIFLNPQLCQRYYNELVMPIFASLEGAIQEKVEAKQMNVKDPALAARLLVATSFGIFLLKAMGDEKMNEHWDTIPHLITDLIFHGLEGGDSFNLKYL